VEACGSFVQKRTSRSSWTAGLFTNLEICFLQIWKNQINFVRQKSDFCGTELQDDYDDLLCDAIVLCPVRSGELLNYVNAVLTKRRDIST